MRKLIETNGIVWNCAIIASHSWRSVQAYNDLLLEARKDFDIDSDDAVCGHALGQRIAGSAMLRFKIPVGSKIPAGWEASERVEELGNR